MLGRLYIITWDKSTERVNDRPLLVSTNTTSESKEGVVTFLILSSCVRRTPGKLAAGITAMNVSCISVNKTPPENNDKWTVFRIPC